MENKQALTTMTSTASHGTLTYQFYGKPLVEKVEDAQQQASCSLYSS